MKKVIDAEPVPFIHIKDHVYNELESMESLLEEKHGYRYFKFGKFEKEINLEIDRSVVLYNNELKIIIAMFRSKTIDWKGVLTGWNNAWKKFESRMICLDQKLQTFKNAYFKNDLIN